MRYEYRYSNKVYTRALEATRNNKMYGGSMSPIEVMKWYEDQVKVLASRDETSSTDWELYIFDDSYVYPGKFTKLEVPVGLPKQDVVGFNEWSRNSPYTIQMKMDWLFNELLVKDNPLNFSKSELDKITSVTPYTSRYYDELKLIEDTLIKHDVEIQARFKELYEPYLVKLAQHREYHKGFTDKEELVVKKLKQQKLEETLAETSSQIYTGIFFVVLIAAITILGVKG